MKICLDAGHGGRDPGAVGPTGAQEKDITLAITTMLKEELEAAGHNITLTRSDDSYITLGVRTRTANTAKADLFISVHCNAAENRAAQGIETYHFPGSTEGAKLAAYTQRALIEATGRPDRGVKTADFQVLRETAMPAILVEINFISNAHEEIMLKVPEYQSMCAEAIAAGVSNYLERR